MLAIPHGYPIMLAGMILEGPLVTIAAGLGAALGYFNIWLVIVLAVTGDLIGDAVYYASGYWGRVRVIDVHGPKFGLHQDQIRKLDRLLHTHPWKALLVIKSLPLLATPGLILAGSTRLPVKEFAVIAFAVTVPRAVLFASLGFLSGGLLGWITSYLGWSQYILLLGVIILFGIYYGMRKLMEKFGEQLES